MYRYTKGILLTTQVTLNLSGKQVPECCRREEWLYDGRIG